MAHHADPCVCDTDTLCHMAGARGLDLCLTGVPQGQSHPAVALMPVGSAVKHLAGPLPLPRGHSQTCRYMRPPEAKLAKELQSGFLDLLVTNTQGKKKVWDFWGLKVAPYLPGTSPKGQEGGMPLVWLAAGQGPARSVSCQP